MTSQDPPRKPLDLNDGNKPHKNGAEGEKDADEPLESCALPPSPLWHLLAEDAAERYATSRGEGREPL